MTYFGEARDAVANFPFRRMPETQTKTVASGFGIGDPFGAGIKSHAFGQRHVGETRRVHRIRQGDP